MPFQNIDWYIKKVESEKIDGGQRRTKAYPFKEDGVILIKKNEDNFDELKARIKKCKELGINIPAYIDYKITDGDTGWVLEELANGNEFANLVNNEEGTEVIANIPYEHIEKYFRDVYLLNINGIGVEPKRRNIFYDEKYGFTTIDVAVLNSISDPSSLKDISYFFDIYSTVLLIPFKDDEYGAKVKEKTISNMLKAFENAHPFFYKYKRWIYRGSPYFANFLLEHGCDLTLDSKEYEDYIDLINQLINKIVDEKIECPEMFYNNSYTSYIQMLENSIVYCHNFSLYNSNEQSLQKYIGQSVNHKIKSMFFKSRNDEVLRNLYFKIRRREIDPINIYDKDEVEQCILEELKAYDKEHPSEIKEKIMPMEALESALIETTREETLKASIIEKNILPQSQMNKGEGRNAK